MLLFTIYNSVFLFAFLYQGTAEEEEKPRETGNDQTTDGDTLDPQSIVEGDRTEGGHQAEDS
jgi:hypothetical protein